MANIHNALFFRDCVNYLDDGERVTQRGNARNIIRQAADNDYNTSTTQKDLNINLSRNNAATRVDAVFVKGRNITTHTATPSGGTGTGYSNRRIPSTIRNFENEQVATTVAGFQHDLYLLPNAFSARSVRFRFTGTNARLFAVMFLEFGIEMNANGDFLQIEPNMIDREGILQVSPGGRLRHTDPLTAERDKWEIDYVLRIKHGTTEIQTPEDFLTWRNANKNCVHAQEFSRFPARVFPATFVSQSVPVRYQTDDKKGTQLVSFKVAEQ